MSQVVGPVLAPFNLVFREHLNGRQQRRLDESDAQGLAAEPLTAANAISDWLMATTAFRLKPVSTLGENGVGA